MEINFIKYNVRPNDTLSSIASRLKITKEDLKNFHNSRCEKMNRLYVENLKGVNYILISTNYTNKEENLKRQQQLLPSKEYSKEFHSEHYTIKENIEWSTEKEISIEYQVDLIVEDKKHQTIISVNQTDFKKDHIKPDDKISSLSIACMQTISPVPFIISGNGILQEIFEPQKVLKKFKNKRCDIEDFFSGEIPKKYLDLFEENLSNENYLFKHLTSTLLYQVLFPKMDWFHKTLVWTEAFTVYPNSFSVHCEFETEHYINNDSQTIKTTVKGNINDHCTLLEVIKSRRFNDSVSDDRIKGEIYIEYTTSTKSKQLSEAQAVITLWQQEELYFKHHLSINQT
ncbi:LysM peptidoglycan-binding domain-containing protein [Chryseobacterium camelliae]|uniref:LysM peptidoglycan-binding domain-containing protein n=1 Tax=Chryseobacterium camelliae TaxID=1265445 RepID=A0ABY7QJI3_9FLAO|nr:LysM peptidoglycan-binding domain-containing protein [Chryseobacterium camelliae]WBV59853.1 LysM peptidoglycan-binding domain-containing protein [Chryseobacterium camelliae]